MRILIDENYDGITVKQYLFSVLQLSRGQITLLKKRERGIVVNEDRVYVTYILHMGDTLELELADTVDSAGEKLKKADIPLEILYEDEDLVAVNKMPHMPTHPSLNHYEDTLANALAYYYREKPFVFRAINRLDRDTSGVVLVAKNRRSAAVLSGMMSKRMFTKEYLALLRGEIKEDGGKIDRNIVRAGESIMLRRTDDTIGEPALTEYSVLERKKGMTLVLARPLTGRTHQLRVHFSYIGYPIVGDGMYGQICPSIDRQALHARSLRFCHPFTGKDLQIVAPLPADFLKLLKENDFEKVLDQV